MCRSEWESLLDDSRAAAISSIAGPSSSDGHHGLPTLSESAANELLRAEIEEAKLEGDHADVLSRLTRHKVKVSSDEVAHVRLRNVFGIFCLAVMSCHGNRFCLSDLIRWARTGAISYHSAIKNVPGVMQLRGNEDFARFQNSKELNSTGCMRNIIFRLGCLLDLKEVNFTADKRMKTYLKRYCR